LLVAAAIFLMISTVSNSGRDPTQATPGARSETAKEDSVVLAPASEDFLEPNPDVTIPEAVTTIPVVVHVVYRTEAENIPDEQVRGQIEALNTNYRARNKNIANVPAPFRDKVGDARIAFTLASTDPEGRPTSGITRTKTNLGSFGANTTSVVRRNSGGKDAWPTGRYLNIWVCNLGNNLRSYVLNFPDKATSDRDGVVIHYESFGANDASTTHEIGHYFGLYHIWGVPKCGDDFVADTPPQQGPNSQNTTFPHITCNNGPDGDMFMNFMDYNPDACMFTKGQVARMHQVLQKFRNGLAVSNQ
ncbi:MAG: zinc metalloprotease, partial [Cytophagales bacterium]|nr:zinc metalloprotease [Cytophagales bacterium]